MSAHALNCTYEWGIQKEHGCVICCCPSQQNWHLPTYYDERENCLNIQFIPAALRPNADQGLLIHEVSRSHNDAPQSVGLLWTSDQPVAETSENVVSQQTNIHAPGGTRARNLGKRAAADPRLRPRGNWDRFEYTIILHKSCVTVMGVHQAIVCRLYTAGCCL